MTSAPAPSSESTGSKRPGDVFPATATWLNRCVGTGSADLTRANVHIMTIYAHPLKVYFQGCSLRWVGEAEDMVRGYFAGRLSRGDFLERWVESGRPLRFWLITGFKHYLLESARAVQRDRRAGSTEALAEQGLEIDADDTRGFDREVALSIVREASAAAQSGCVRDGLAAHWELFVAHHVGGMSYEALAPRFGVDRARAAVMVRTVANRFRSELRSLVAWEGASEDEIDREIRSLLEVTGS